MSSRDHEVQEFRRLVGLTPFSPSDLTLDYVRQTGQADIYSFIVADNQDNRGYLKSYFDPARAEEVMSKRSTLKSVDTSDSPGVSLLADRKTILYLWPNDGELRGLRWATDLNKLKRQIGEAGIFGSARLRARKSSIEIIKYKPEQRVVGRLIAGLVDEKTKVKSSSRVTIRVLPAGQATELVRIGRNLHQQGLEDIVPKQLGSLLDGSVHLEEFVEGKELLSDSRDIPTRDVAAALTRLGQSVVEGRPVVVPARFLTVSADYTSPTQDALCSTLRQRIKKGLKARAGHFENARLGTNHGDLHPKQILVADTTVTFVDFDKCFVSAPVFDAGHLVAEILMRSYVDVEGRKSLESAAQELCSDWLELNPDVPEHCLELAVALGLIAGGNRAERQGVPSESALSAHRLLEEALARIESLPEAEWPNSDVVQVFPSRREPWAAELLTKSTSHAIRGVFHPSSGRFEEKDPREDQVLPALASYEGQLKSWRAGRRAVAIVENEGARTVRKFLAPARTTRAQKTLEVLRRSCPPDLLPRLLGCDVAKGTIDLSFLEGVTLHTMLPELAHEDIQAAGRAVGRFHSCQADDELDVSGGHDLEWWRDQACTHFPQQKEAIEASFRGLPNHSDTRLTLIHGDLHDKNLLIHDGKAKLIDIEGAKRGAPSEDVGNLIAHLDWRARQFGLSTPVCESWQTSFQEGYAGSGPPLDASSVEAVSIRTMFRLACVYMFRPQWRAISIETFRRMSLLFVLVATIVLSGCVALVSKPLKKTENNPDAAGNVRLGTSFLKKKDTIEVEGEFDGGVFRAKRIEIEEEDDELELKSTIDSVDSSGGHVTMRGRDFRVDDKTELLGLNEEKLSLPDLEKLDRQFAKLEAIEREGEYVLRKLRLRERKENESDELQGMIDELSQSRDWLKIGDFDVRYQNSTPVFWDVAGKEPPALEERGLRPRSRPRLKQILRIDDDDIRQGSGIQLADGITMGGEVQWELEWRRNHNLRKGRPRDRLVHEPSLTLEFSLDVSDHIFAFLKVRGGQDWGIFDERDGNRHGSRFGVTQAYFVLLDFLVDGLALEIGRQKFDHGREWVMDDEIDAVRLFVNTNDVLVEFSVSQKLYDESPEEDGITNFLLAAHFEPFDSELFVYALYRWGGQLLDLNRFHFGFSFTKTWDEITLWADLGYVIGEEGKLDVEGAGFDVMAMYVFDQMDWEPSIYAGFAWGSGDDDLSDGKDSSFRQTGIQDNNDRFNGVTGFRYLGELFRPEVSNMTIFTAGVGFRPLKDMSVDLLFHHYRQVVSSTTILDSRLRLNPAGTGKTLGTEFDLVIGINTITPIEIEIVWGYFTPGSAFGQFQDDAWFMTLQVEFNF